MLEYEPPWGNPGKVGPVFAFEMTFKGPLLRPLPAALRAAGPLPASDAQLRLDSEGPGPLCYAASGRGT